MSSRPSWEERGHPRGPGCGSTAMPCLIVLSLNVRDKSAELEGLGWIRRCHKAAHWAEQTDSSVLYAPSQWRVQPRIRPVYLTPAVSHTITYGDDYICLIFLICCEFCAPFEVVCVNQAYQNKVVWFSLVLPLMEENHIYLLYLKKNIHKVTKNYF